MEIKAFQLHTGAPPNPAWVLRVVLPFFLLLLMVFSSCSTVRSFFKKSGDIFTIRRQAETQLGQGNKEADNRQFDDALRSLSEAWRLAVSVDDPDLRIRIKLSISYVLFSMGSAEEAEAGWNEALIEARQIKNDELAAISRIHINRGKLLADKNAAMAVRDEVGKDITLIKKDRFYTAFAWTVMGLAEKELGDYAAAEKAVKRSLAIHDKDRYFELAAYDWFMIASFRSLAGDYKGARQALENAVAFDRRVENSWGLANDWRALGDVHKKAGEREAARAAYTRAAGIFRALGNEEAAANALSKIE